ncbi:nanos homolog 3 [Orussus abietinus]|uniref:nanos homolog 3 n=1 Tax=Orussus abietinus TaxID=222816 RepID=UPI000625C2E7|nr:nanos homolog 3 [Orussus abietinus]
MVRALAARQLPMLAVPNSLYPLNKSMDEEMKRLFDNLDMYTISKPTADDIMEEFRHNGQDFEYCPDFETTVPRNPRRKKNKKPIPNECVFCKNNGESADYYKRHRLKDAEGRVCCPILRAYKCPICGAFGDRAHTVKYCPLNQNPETVATSNTLKIMRNSSGKRRNKQNISQASYPRLLKTQNVV